MFVVQLNMDQIKIRMCSGDGGKPADASKENQCLLNIFGHEVKAI